MARRRDSEPDRQVGPRGQARRRALLDAAAQLFVTKGYDKTTLSDLVDAAGGSRATIYELFGDKAGLFRAMMKETNGRILDVLVAGRPAVPVPPEEALVRIATSFLTGILNDDVRAVVRVLVSESGRVPDIAEEFWESGPSVIVARVADCLRALADGNGLRVEDPEDAAQIFLGMVVGEFFMKGLILPDRPVTGDEIERRARYAVRLFLDGIRAAPEPAGCAAVSGAAVSGAAVSGAAVSGRS